MVVMLDILGSMIIGGMVLLAVITLNTDMTDSSERMTHDLVVQENMMELAREVEYDFYKIGYRDSTGSPITAADSTSITFRGDIDDDGSLDSVRYYLGPVGELSSTPNPNDRMLYRVFNAETPRSSNMGVVGCRFTYYDASDSVTTVLANIRGIRIALDVESPYPYSDTTFATYAGQHWRAFIVPMNIQ